MKWHDARKEWPKENTKILAITNTLIDPLDRYVTAFVLPKTLIGSETIKLHSSLMELYRAEVDYWCYIDEIPKPGEQ